MRGWSCCRTVTAPLSFLTRGEHSALPNALAGIQISPLRRNSLVMPEDDVTERAREDEREGLSPSTQAGEFVREEMEHIREGKHGARSPQQAIAIGLSKAQRKRPGHDNAGDNPKDGVLDLGSTGCQSAKGRIRCGEPVTFGSLPNASGWPHAQC